ncbi:MAG: hypothetical protein ACOX83_09250, partial [Candidatus Spyradocola sp.]
IVLGSPALRDMGQKKDGEGRPFFVESGDIAAVCADFLAQCLLAQIARGDGRGAELCVDQAANFSPGIAGSLRAADKKRTAKGEAT